MANDEQQLTDDVFSQYGTFEQIYGETPAVPAEVLTEFKSMAQKATNTLEPALASMGSWIGDLAATVVGAVIHILWNVLQPILPQFYHYKGLAEAYSEHGARQGLAAIRPTPLDVSTIISLLHKYPGQYDAFKTDLNMAGLSDDRQSAAMAEFKMLPDIGIITQLLLREFIDPASARDFLLRNRIREEDVDNLMKLFYSVPGIGDQIRMATRKVWDIGISLKYGYDQGLQDEFLKYCSQNGVSDEWARKIWASHWQVPDYQVGLEMFHRLDPAVVQQTPERWATMGLTGADVQTTWEDVDELMNTLDVLPYWRQRLKAISYTPLTQRYMLRLYANNVMTDADVYAAYKELGFDDINAARMTAFCKLDSVNREKDLSKEEILKAYDEKLITVDIVTQYLTALKYSLDEINLLIAMHDYTNEKKIKDARLTAIKNKYLKHGYDDREVQTQLTTLALTAAEIDSYFQTWKIEKDSKAETLSNTDLRTAFVNDFITQADFNNRMVAKGYMQPDIDIIIQIELGKKNAKLLASQAASQSEA